MIKLTHNGRPFGAKRFAAEFEARWCGLLGLNEPANTGDW